MLTDLQSPGPTNTLATNNHSLCGQVLQFTSAADLGTLSIAGVNCPIAQSAELLSNITSCTSQNSQTSFSRPLKKREDLPGAGDNRNLGKASYFPVNAFGKKDAQNITLGGKEHVLFNVPQSILDGLSTDARADFHNHFIRLNPHHIVVPENELYDYESTETGTKTILKLSDCEKGIRLKARIKKTIGGPGENSNHLFKISCNAEMIDITGDETDDVAVEIGLKKYLHMVNAAGSGSKEEYILRTDNFSFYLLSKTPNGISGNLLTGIKSGKCDSDELLEFYCVLDNTTAGPEQADILIIPNGVVSDANGPLPVYFNVLLKPTDSFANFSQEALPLFLQKNYFNFKFNQSVNGLNTFTEVTLQPSNSFSASAAAGTFESLLCEHTNFNKLRLSLQPPVGAALKINNTDVLAPVAEDTFGQTKNWTRVAPYYRLLVWPKV